MFSYSKSIIWFPILIVILHISFLIFGLYTILPQLDMLMHFLGGVWATMLFFYLFGNIFQNELYSNNTEVIKIIIVAISFAILIGVLWEFFEFIATIITSMQLQGNLADTMKDLLMDIIGGAFGGIMGVFHMRKLV